LFGNLFNKTKDKNNQNCKKNRGRNEFQIGWWWFKLYIRYK
jgi:hypothetical protein